MRRPAALALLAILLLAPVATACSLSRPPAGPGYIWLHGADGTLLRTIEVEDQSLGGDCSLANVIGLTSRYLAWHDDDRIRRLDLATHDVVSVRAPRGGDLVLADAGLLARDVDWDGTTSNTTWTLHRWDGTVTSPPLPRSWAHLLWSDGQNGVIQTRTAPRDNVTTWIHDLATGAVVAGPFNDTVVAGGADWTVVSDGASTLTLMQDGLRAGEVRDARYRSAITKQGVWSEDGLAEEGRVVLHRWDGTRSDGFAVEGGLLAATGTHVATGIYAKAWRTDPFAHFGPAPVGLLIGLLLLALAGWRRA